MNFRERLIHFVFDQILNILYYTLKYWIELILILGVIASVIGTLLVTGAESYESRFWGFVSMMCAAVLFGSSYLGSQWKNYEP